MTNMDKLYEAVEARGPVCVGLDTDFSYLPADFVDSTLTRGENIVRFNQKLIDATKAVAGCYKVQIAYYESLGLEGMKAYADTLKAVREAGVPVIADIKRGDIAKTAEMYAMGHFTGDFEADFVTLAPYMGLDSISPYLPYAEKQGKGLFVLCRTSNGGAKDYEGIAAQAAFVLLLQSDEDPGRKGISYLSISRNSASILSVSSGARICR